MSKKSRPFHPSIVTLDLRAARPTQISVGMAEVDDKRREWQELGRAKRQDMIGSHVFPGVLGPDRQVYIVDHHHLGLAMLLDGITTATTLIQRDFSMLEGSVFWRTMEYFRWAHPYDRDGHRVAYSEIPDSLHGMQDDPYRALSAYVRTHGGYAKDALPYSEFLWADFFRPRFKLKKSRPAKADIKRAVELAQQPEASYLPGWSGPHHA
ncbi:MAG: chromosome partitioning protein ParB [Proteobacteria bacterium]|nr:chromosome partitioning protein ParB [Pseudomonadota bacterium]